MRFGIGPFSAEQAGGISTTEAYEIMSDATCFAEVAGFDSVWIAERQFVQDGYCPQPFVAAANLAAKTESIHIGVLPIAGLTHPLYLAEDAAVLDNLSNGRAIVVPINAVSHELKAYGIEPDSYPDRYRETIEVLLKAWTPTPFKFEGKYWTIPAMLEGHSPIESGTVVAQPQPAQFELPLWIGGFWQTGRELAASMGLPVVLGAISDNAELGKLWAEYDAALPVGRHRPRVLIRDVYVSTGDDPSAEIAGMISYQFDRYKTWGLWSGDSSDMAQMQQRGLIVGNPAEVIAQIRAIDEAHPLDHLICRMHFPGMPLPQLIASMTLFSREVIPNFRMPNLPRQILEGV
jgi:alkanesulfonate monooxygenase SsuD/methylene tetrahydromethanopterin reductase-like flavin-dependent oxidoreductase (luciferase family)